VWVGHRPVYLFAPSIPVLGFIPITGRRFNQTNLTQNYTEFFSIKINTAAQMIKNISTSVMLMGFIRLSFIASKLI
jgi:hypothetical protein